MVIIFPVVLESIGDESTIDQFEQKRFYVQNFEMQLQGYIMDEEEYEVTPAIKRVVTLFETEPNAIPSRNQTDGLNPEPELEEYSVELIWEPGSNNEPGASPLTKEFLIKHSALLTEYTLVNARDCEIVSDDCAVTSPRFQVSTDGVTFVGTSFPLQVIPDYKIRAYLTPIDTTIDMSMTVRGYINQI